MAAGRLDVLLGLNAAEFTAGLTKAEYATKKFQKDIKQSLDGIGTAFKAVIGGIAVKQIIDGFVGIVGALDDLDEAAQALGTTATALAEFRRAAGESGVSAEKFDASLTKLSVKLTDAASGGKESAATFKALGIDIKNSSGQLLTTEELLGKVADKFAGYADGAEKTALAVQLFGKAGAAMIPFLNQGSDGLRKFAGVTEEGVKAAQQLQAQFDEMSAGLKAIGIEIATSVIPFLTKMIQEFLAATQAAGGFFGAIKLLAGQSAETLADPGKKIAALTEELQKLKATADDAKGLFQIVDNTERTAAIEKELKFLKELQRNRAIANAPGKGYREEGFGTLPGAPVVPDTTKVKDKIDEAKRAFEQYAEQLNSVIEKEMDLTRVQQVSNDLNKDKYKKLTEGQRQYLLGLAAEIDANTEYAQKIKFNAEQEREFMRALTERQAIIDRYSSSNKSREDAKTLEVLASEIGGSISIIDYDLARSGFEGIKDEIKETTSAAEELGLVFTSAIGDFIKNPSDGKSFFKALLEDVLQLTTQLLILKPLAEGMTEIFGGTAAKSDGGKQIAEIGSWIGSLFAGSFAQGTDFVPADGLAMVHRGERIVPAKENSTRGAGGMTLNINQSFAPGTSRETINQAAAAASRQLSRSNRRNN